MNSQAMERRTASVMDFLIGKLGLNLQGAMILDVVGRKSGKTYSLPVNPLHHNGQMYLMAARGETAWVKNARASGEVTLRRGRTAHRYYVEPVREEEKLAIMRAYLTKWGWQVKSFMLVGKDASDDEIRAILPEHPIFRLVRR